MGTSIVLDSLIRGAGIFAALLFCALLLRRGFLQPLVWRGIAFGFGVSSYLICSALWFETLPIGLYAILLLFCMVNPLLFWLFARSLFEDEISFGRREAAVTVVFSCTVAALLLARQYGHGEAINADLVIKETAGLILVLHIMFETARHYNDDLLEPRRRLRIYALGVVGSYMIAIAISEFILRGAEPGAVVVMINALAISTLAVAITFASVTLRSDLFPDVPRAPAGVSKSPEKSLPQNNVVDEKLTKKVLDAMKTDKLFRDETLSVAALASKLGTQEYLLRRAINQGLSQRNFSQFLNAYRLSEIKVALGEPTKSHLPILTIALDAGFNSIGPFNRAFKQTYGVTPSQFRRSRRAETT